MAGMLILGICFVVYRNVHKTKDAESNDPQVVTLIKIFVNYLQINGLVSNLKVKFSESMEYLLDTEDKISSFGGMELKSFNCRAGLSYFEKYRGYALSPLLFVVGCVLANVALYVRKLRNKQQALSAQQLEEGGQLEQSQKPREEQQSASSEVSPVRVKDYFIQNENSCWTVLYLIYPMVSREILQIFVCESFGIDASGREVHRLSLDKSVACDTAIYESHKNLGVICVLLYCFGIPALLFARLFVFRAKLEGISTQRRFGFLFVGYQLEFWWWEITVMVRKLAMVCITVFSAGSEYFQLVFTAMVAGIGTVAQLSFKPYDNVVVNNFEFIALSTNSITLMGGLVFHGGPSKVVSEFTTVILMGFNIVVVLFFIVLFVTHVHQSGIVRDAVTKVRLLFGGSAAAAGVGAAAAAAGAVHADGEVGLTHSVMALGTSAVATLSVRNPLQDLVP